MARSDAGVHSALLFGLQRAPHLVAFFLRTSCESAVKGTMPQPHEPRPAAYSVGVCDDVLLWAVPDRGSA